MILKQIGFMWTIDLPVTMKDGSSDQYAINMRSFLLSYPASPSDLDHELRYLADIFRTESILEPVSWLRSKVPSTVIGVGTQTTLIRTGVYNEKATCWLWGWICCLFYTYVYVSLGMWYIKVALLFGDTRFITIH